MKAAVYLRVSSKDGRQDEANQEPDCVQLCAARGWDPVFFRERESGAKQRPVWDSVIEAARKGEVRAVVFWSTDRIGRTRVDSAKDLAKLVHFGPAVVSCRERIIDIPAGGAATSPIVAMMREQAIGWLTFFAEDERRKLIERTNAGLDRARAKGVKLGRRPADAKKLEEAAIQVLNGTRLAAAAREVGIGRTTLRDYMAEKGLRVPLPKTAKRQGR